MYRESGRGKDLERTKEELFNMAYTFYPVFVSSRVKGQIVWTEQAIVNTSFFWNILSLAKKEMYLHSDHSICVYFSEQKCIITPLAYQWILCIEWVLSKLESKQLIKTS